MCRICESYVSGEDLTGVTELICNGCLNIHEIPQLLNLQELYCRGCPNIREIPQLPNLQVLSCNGCLIREIPQLPNLRELWCRDCPNIREIHQLSSLQELYCNNCPLLITDNELVDGQINIVENKERIKRLQILCQKIKRQECLNWLMICNSTEERSSMFYKVPIDVIRIINEMYLRRWDISTYNCGEFSREVVEWELFRY